MVSPSFFLRAADTMPLTVCRCHPVAVITSSTVAPLSGVEPQIRPLADERAIEKRMHALVDLPTQLGNLRLADPGQPHRLHQIVAPPGRHAADPRLLDHRDQRLLRALAGFEKRREVA